MTSVERAFPALLQDFFHRRLVAQRGASAHTIASYRDTFTLFLGYAAQRTGRTPSALTLSDLDAPLVLGFLDHLETERSNSPRTRNLRLTAIRSFMRYASLREPTLLPVAQRVLAIPVKRFDRPVLGYLSREEVTAIIDAPDRSTWSGQRDAVLFAVLYNTGARVSEITRLHVADVLLERASSPRVRGSRWRRAALAGLPGPSARPVRSSTSHPTDRARLASAATRFQRGEVIDPSSPTVSLVRRRLPLSGAVQGCANCGGVLDDAGRWRAGPGSPGVWHRREGLRVVVGLWC